MVNQIRVAPDSFMAVRMLSGSLKSALTTLVTCYRDRSSLEDFDSGFRDLATMEDSPFAMSALITALPCLLVALRTRYVSGLLLMMIVVLSFVVVMKLRLKLKLLLLLLLSWAWLVVTRVRIENSKNINFEENAQTN